MPSYSPVTPDILRKIEKAVGLDATVLNSEKLCEFGTISGEHGIGIAKKRSLPMELSSESIRIQKEIKHIFDPRGILNPGKIFQAD